jgi:hypothetical protein
MYNFHVQAVNSNRDDPRIAAVQPLQVSFAAVYRGNNSPDLAREPDRIISMELWFHGCVGLAAGGRCRADPTGFKYHAIIGESCSEVPRHPDAWGLERQRRGEHVATPRVD